MNPSNELLFTPLSLGKLTLKNRIVMAPMTRSRAPGGIPNEAMARYYALRAETGLIVTEGASPSPNGLGYPRIPGAFSPEQAKGWRQVADAVHAEGGKIFIQLMHTGRASHSLNLPQGARVIAPSPIALSGKMYTDQQQLQAYPVPEEMSLADIRTAVTEYARSAELSVNQGGLDGVELHGANGYLIDQFLNPASNQRKDEYGGAAENRIRFALEVAKATAALIGPDRLGIRVSPYGVFNDQIAYDGIEDTFVLLARKLSELGLVYLHVVDHSAMGAPEVPASIKAKLRSEFKNRLILSGGYDAVRAEADLKAGRADLIAFGRPLISNPKLVSKLRTGAPLLATDMKTLYTPGEPGYLDYPV